MQSPHSSSPPPPTSIVGRVALLVWLVGVVGCAGKHGRDESIDRLTRPALPYPTAVASPSTALPTATSRAAEATSPAADSQAAVVTESQPTDISNQPYKSTPLQLPEQVANPIPLPARQDVPTPLPLAPHQRPLNFPVAVAPPQPKAQAEQASPATSAEPSTTEVAAQAQMQATAQPATTAEAPATSHATVQPAAAPQQAPPAAVGTTASYAPSAESQLVQSIGANSVLSESTAASFPTPSVVSVSYEANVASSATAAAPQTATAASAASVYSPAGQLPPPTEPTPPPAATARQEAANDGQPPVATQPPTLAEHRAALIAALETEIRQRREAKAEPAELARLELQLRLLYLLAERPDDAVAAIDALSAPERESCKHLLFGLATLMAEEPPSRAPHRNAKVLRALRDATSELAAGSRLDLRNMAFCEKVEYFGWYTEFPRYEFTPKQQVILYVEVENYAAEAKGPQSFETELQGSYQIFDASGQIIAERKLPLDREVCRNYRRDYFLAYRIYMPDNIAPGGYRLELTLEDLKARGQFQGRKLGLATIDFSIR